MVLIKDNLNKKTEQTTPKDIKDPPRSLQITETTKDAFVLEIRKFFNRNDISNDRLSEIPTIRKFDVSYIKGSKSGSSAVEIIRKLPDQNENLPVIAVLATTGRNLPLGLKPYVHTVAANTYVQSNNQEPFNLSNNQTLKFITKTPDNIIRYTTIVFRGSKFNDISQATAQEVVDEINFQSLYARASLTTDNKINISYGGIADSSSKNSVTGDIKIGFDGDAGTAASALGFVLDQEAIYTSTIPFNRYYQASSIDIGLEIVTEDENTRTELTDLLWSFLTIYMTERDNMFLGRSIFNPSIPNETYQVIIKPDLSIAGENEIPRPSDERDKLYVNRINVSVTTIWYVDRAVVQGDGVTPFYNDAANIVIDETIPKKN